MSFYEWSSFCVDIAVSCTVAPCRSMYFSDINLTPGLTCTSATLACLSTQFAAKGSGDADLSAPM